jgi:hypothetical protein
MTITIGRGRFWVWLCRLAYRRAVKRGPVPSGLPGHRDPDATCRAYFPVKAPSGDGPCESDGHYLCSGCEWITAERLAERTAGDYRASS